MPLSLGFIRTSTAIIVSSSRPPCPLATPLTALRAQRAELAAPALRRASRPSRPSLVPRKTMRLFSRRTHPQALLTLVCHQASKTTAGMSTYPRVKRPNPLVLTIRVSLRLRTARTMSQASERASYQLYSHVKIPAAGLSTRRNTIKLSLWPTDHRTPTAAPPRKRPCPSAWDTQPRLPPEGGVTSLILQRLPTSLPRPRARAPCARPAPLQGPPLLLHLITRIPPAWTRLALRPPQRPLSLSTVPVAALKAPHHCLVPPPLASPSGPQPTTASSSPQCSAGAWLSTQSRQNSTPRATTSAHSKPSRSVGAPSSSFRTPSPSSKPQFAWQRGSVPMAPYFGQGLSWA